MKVSAFRLPCVLAMVLVLGSSAIAEQSKQSKAPAPAPAPVPAQITAAQTAFIGNAGGDDVATAIDQTVFHGSPDRSYNEFYNEMKGWARYRLVSSPDSADLVFEIGWTLTDTGLKLPVLGKIRLVAIDPKTHATLWTITEYVRGAILLENRDKNFEAAMDLVLDRLKKLALPAS